jgi:hypothetical protein
MGVMRGAPLPIRLDFSARRKSPSILGWALLGAGLILVGMEVAAYRATEQDLRQMESRVNQLRLERSKDDSEPVRATRGGVSAEEKHAAFAIARRLNADWDLMFAGVAVAGNDGVTWLSLNGDLGQGSLGVVGEARTLPSMFDFLTRLEASPGIADARLSSYEFRRDGAGDIVRFNVVAKWAGDQQ